jgi:glutaredoxin
MAEEQTVKIKIPRINPWMVATAILAVALVAVLATGFSLTGKVAFTGSNFLTPEEAGKKAVEYINKNLVQSGTSASFVSANDLGSVYEVITSYQGKQIKVYTTKDGTFLFLSAFDTSVNLQKEQPPSQEFKPEKTDKPVAQLFVMSFCPYGQAAEKAMKPVVDLLGDKTTIEPHFIVSVSGTTVNSLHGEYEANEDMRQACIWKYYGQKTFWNYVDYIDNNCNRDNIDTCWKDAAKNAGVDVSKIEDCFTKEGLELMKSEEALTSKYGVTGSPTLIINGATYNGARTPEAYKQAICSAFTTPPSECSQTLSSSGSTASGGCG